VVKSGREAGVRFLIDSDSHSHKDLFLNDFQEKVAEGAGLEADEIRDIFSKNNKDFLAKIGY